MESVIHLGTGTSRLHAVRAPLRVLALSALMLAGTLGTASAASTLLVRKCGGCHQDKADMQRIADIRKSPEGWDMTIVRMGIWHKVPVSRDERKALVKYLADAQGLAPDESAPYRRLIERQPNIDDAVPTPQLGEMCGRCHSFGRVALQRRDTQEWRKLIHTHVGQFPSVEYSALGRDRNWLDIALGEVAPRLGELYPLRTPSWKAWRSAKHRPPTGAWRVAGYRPGAGAYAGYMQVRPLGGDRYEVKYDFTYDSGNHVVGEGKSVIYTGYEWRGSARVGNQEVRSIFAIGADGRTMSGRWFLAGADEIGARFEAVRIDGAAPGAIMAVSPALLKAGASTVVRVSGVKLGKTFDFGPDTQVEQVSPVSADEALVTVRVGAEAAAGWRKVGRGADGEDARIAVYRQFDAIRVEPALAFARLGGGTNAPVSAQFEAVAYLNGPDGKPGTDDDVRLGPVDAAWSVDNYDDKAKAADDVKFAGVMEPNGQFLPAIAGPNPARGGHNNAGDLAVTATVQDGARTLTGNGRVVSAVQRWNLPPLR